MYDILLGICTLFDCPVSGLNWDLKVVSCSSLKNLKHLVNVKFFTDGGSWTFFSPGEPRVAHDSRFDLNIPIHSFDFYLKITVFNNEIRDWMFWLSIIFFVQSVCVVLPIRFKKTTFALLSMISSKF